ncbi:type VII secretion protein EccCa [Mycolicibacterium brumae]|uniref:Type VII secretion protein EccC n=1 Tax=Mycolicibacterium brumae TaxID=85968 RepID=A0A2G5PE98_9MYCO|nr:type VII secretion protein EccCa [Mycolicibacterium brumae]MCV7191759.1 type VII secretion protein EccCa [Mycolicibacterium brumae]PIB76353.1 type VII secretion protein EccC [Mycolicibacterium brumae]RWA15866.1 membrane protein [Mycolicibacterium brumae DSM 44177]UWW07065.1 type VII secretion protein EccCa [Mycolicibacterium brumae]
MSKRGYVRAARVLSPAPPPARVAVAAPLALPEREPRNILLMIAIPALLVGIIGTLVVMYASGVRSLQSGFFPMVGLVAFGAMMFSGRFGRTRKISWGEQEKQRRIYLRQLDEDRDEIQRAATELRNHQLRTHPAPEQLASVIGGPRMWERRSADPDFLDVRLGVGEQQSSDAAVSLQWPEVPIAEELEPVTGGALRDFMLEQSRIRGVAKVLSLRSRPGFSFVGEDAAALRDLTRAMLTSLAVQHSPADLKIMVVTRAPQRWDWLLWLPHNQHDELFDACGMRRLVFAAPTDLEETLDAELHRKGRGPWAPPSGASPVTIGSPMESPGPSLGPHWLIVDDGAGTPEGWEGVTGQKGMAGITVLRLAARPGVGVGFGAADERFELRDGVLRHRGAFYAKPDLLPETTAARHARALSRWTPLTAAERGERSAGGELLRALGIGDPRHFDFERLWAERRGRGDPKWAMVPVGVKPGGELQHIVLRAKDFDGFGFHSVVIGTSGSGKSEYFLSLCNGIALTHSPETFTVIFVDMKFESAAQDLEGLPHVAGSLSNLGKDDRHLAERMRKAINGEIARRYRLFKQAGARDANEYEEMRLAGRQLEPVPILLVIIDEYLELFQHHPDWIDLVIHIGQEGRGCNVFFTLGGQRLDLSSLSKAKSNIAFRVALRAETGEDSRDVIGSEAALHLPSRDNGYALLKVGPRDLEAFRCFYVSAPFVVPKRDAGPRTVDLSFGRPRALSWEHQPLSAADSAALELLHAPEPPDEFLYHADGFRKQKLLEVIRDAVAALPTRPPHRIWLPPLEDSEPADRLVELWRGRPWREDYGDNPGLVFPIAMEDLPDEHAQRVHVIDAAMDNVMVVATTQRGKSTTLMTLMITAALLYRPERITFYCLGAALYPVEGLPQVAAVVSLADAEGVSRTVATLEALVRAREASFKQHQIDIAEFRARRFGPGADGRGTDAQDRFGDVFLVVDNFGDLYEKDMATGDRVIALARQGLSYGVHVMSSASGWLVGQRQALINVSNARVQLRLSNPDETQMGTGIDHRRAARRVPDRPGFGVTAEGHELLVGVPEIDGPNGRLTTRQVGLAIAEATGAQRVDTLARLPGTVGLGELSRAFTGADPWQVPFALGESLLAPVALPTASVPNLLVVGRQGCGKTTALAAVAQSAMGRLTPEQLRIVIIDPKTSLIGRVQGPHVSAYAYTADDIDTAFTVLADLLAQRLPPSGLTQQELLDREPWAGPHYLVLIDDEQELRPGGAVLGKPAASAPLWPLIERSREIGLHVVAARMPGNWAGVSMINPLLQRLTAARTPTLFMDNDPSMVKVFGRVSAQQLPPGRGLLVSVEGEMDGVLVGLPD